MDSNKFNKILEIYSDLNSNQSYENLSELNEFQEFLEFFEDGLDMKLNTFFDNDQHLDQLDDFLIDEELSLDGLTHFLELAKAEKLDTDSTTLKGLSVKVTENQKQLLDFVSEVLGKSRSKVLQELVKTYMDSAYLTYLNGKHQMYQNYHEIDKGALINELRSDAIALDDNNHTLTMLYKLRYKDEACKELESLAGETK